MARLFGRGRGALRPQQGLCGGRVPPVVEAAVRLALAAVVLVALFGILYRVLPNRAQGWRQVWPGAALAVLLWLVLAQLFSVYLAHFNSYNATYGSIGGIIITLVFFQYSATVFLLGAELNILLEEKRGR